MLSMLHPGNFKFSHCPCARVTHNSPRRTSKELFTCNFNSDDKLSYGLSSYSHEVDQCILHVERSV